ncbi:amidohydrolase [Kiloniella majae]|uniref:amidohydrolase n=1 Tax=Kiloniella majae TaxID=1938558 RepID=UPI000A27838D|nr:amidohydrolase [Kiloniella majae]
MKQIKTMLSRMIPTVKTVGFSVGLISAFLAQSHASSDDYLILNAQIYTVDKKMPWAEAVLVEDGVIAAVGTEKQLFDMLQAGTEVIDLGGRMLLPGFQDPHLHALEAGINETVCFLSAEGAEEVYRQEIAYCLDDQRDVSWFIGAGVSMPALLGTVESPMAFLDRLIPDRPAVILDNLGHGAWANTKAMQAVGYLDFQETPGENPPGGLIDRDPVSGRLTGVVFENAQQKLRNAALPPTKGNVNFAYESLLQALDLLAENGITTVSDAGGYWPRGHQEAWIRAEEENLLTVRASNALYLYPDLPFEEQIAEFQKRYSNDPEKLLRFNQAKIYVDGILSQATGALYQPYEASLDLPKDLQRGFLYFQEETLFDYVSALKQLGFQVHFHATGDRGVGLALDAVAQAKKVNSPTDIQHRITHLYLVDKKDVSRFRELNVITDFQLAPSSTNSDTKRYLAGFIGQRAEGLMPARKLYEAGVEMVLSSDWDAEELSPLMKIEAVLTQRDGAFDRVETVIEMMTLNVAKLLQHEDKTGSIEPGKLADFVVLDRNILDIPIDEIGAVNVEATLLGGEPVYDPEGLFK